MSMVIEMPEVLQVTVSGADVSSAIDDLFADTTPPMPQPQPGPEAEPDREVETEAETETEADQDVESNPQPQPQPQPALNGVAAKSHAPAAPATLLEEIHEQNKYIRYCEGEIEHCKGELKAAKENFDQALSRLRMLCEKLTKPLENDGERPLLDAQPEPQPEAKTQPEDEEPIYGESFGEEVASQVGETTDPTKIVTSRPVRIRIVKDVLEDIENPQSPILAKVGEVFDVMKVETESLIDGGVVLEDEVYIQVGDVSICLEPEEFDVIEWEQVQPETEQPAEAEPESPSSDLISVLGISESQAAKFSKVGINTVAELKEKLASGFDLTTVPGVGKAKAEKFSSLLADHG